MNVLESEITVLNTKAVFIHLYTSVRSLQRDFDNPVLLELFGVEIRRILAQVLTERPDGHGEAMKEPPIDPNDFQLFTYSTDGALSSPHNIRADYLLRVEGTDVQSARDRSAQMEVRRRILELVQEGKEVEVRFV